MGYDDDVGIANGIRDYPTRANAHYSLADESYFDELPGDNAIQFGDGDVDDAEDGDTIVHEYGHAIQHAQNVNWGGGHMPSMGEGFGDYLAASFFADVGDPTYQASDAACVAEWDAYPCLRRVDNNRRYPGGLGGSPHSEGQIWSRALWDIRGAVGREVADTVILEHHFALPYESSMPEAALAVLQADADIYGGIHDTAIRAVFCDRGILSGATCSVVVTGYDVAISPDEAKAADVGETVTYTIQITNLGTVADSFTLNLSGNVWTTEIDNSSVSLGIGGVDTAVVTVTIPIDGVGMDAVTVTATSQGDNGQQDTAVLTTSANGTVFYGVDLSPHSAQDGFIDTIVTYTLQITNTGTVADNFSLAVSGNSWGSEVEPNSISLGVGGMDTAVVSVMIPHDALVGNMDGVTVTATSQGNNAEQDTAVLTTTAVSSVPEFYDLELSTNLVLTEDVGLQVIYNYWVTNTGNLSDTFDLVVSGNNWVTDIDPTSLNLNANETTVTTMTVTIPLTATQDEVDVATLTVTSQGNPSQNASATATTTANIPEYGLNLSGDQTLAGDGGEVVTYTIQLTNVGENSDTFDIVVSGNSWSTIPDSNSESLASGAQTIIDVVVTIPENQDASDTAVVTFTSQGDSQVSKSITLTTNRLTYNYLPMIIKP